MSSLVSFPYPHCPVSCWVVATCSCRRRPPVTATMFPFFCVFFLHFYLTFVRSLDISYFSCLLVLVAVLLSPLSSFSPLISSMYSTIIELYYCCHLCLYHQHNIIDHAFRHVSLCSSFAAESTRECENKIRLKPASCRSAEPNAR